MPKHGGRLGDGKEKSKNKRKSKLLTEEIDDVAKTSWRKALDAGADEAVPAEPPRKKATAPWPKPKKPAKQNQGLESVAALAETEPAKTEMEPEAAVGAGARELPEGVLYLPEGVTAPTAEEADTVHLRSGNADLEDIAEARREAIEGRARRRAERKASKRKPADDDDDGAPAPVAAEAAAGAAEAAAEAGPPIEHDVEVLWDPEYAQPADLRAAHRPLAPPGTREELARGGRFLKLRQRFREQCLRVGVRIGSYIRLSL
jgi:hypothetical protein